MLFLPMPELTYNDIYRFINKFQQSNNCWLWFASTDDSGYGLFRIKTKLYKANRVSYWLHKQIDPGPLLVLHSCNTPRCVNPQHLELGTHEKNTEDSFKQERNRTATFTIEQIKQIRESKLSARELATLYKVPYITMYQIVRNINWRNV